MKQTINDHQLQDMTVPAVELRHNQARLRRVLVSQAAERTNRNTSFLQGVIYFMNKRTLFTGVGIAGALALAVVTVSSFTAAPVSAMQLAQDSTKALQSIEFTDRDVSGLSQQEVTYKKYAPQFERWLAAAQQADDLQVLGYDDVKAYAVATEGCSIDQLCIIDNPADGQTPDVHTLKYLTFTLTEGQAKSKIVIGVNQHNVPEAALIQVITPGQSRG